MEESPLIVSKHYNFVGDHRRYTVEMDHIQNIDLQLTCK